MKFGRANTFLFNKKIEVERKKYNSRWTNGYGKIISETKIIRYDGTSIN